MPGCRTVTSLLCLVCLACTFCPGPANALTLAAEPSLDPVSLLDEACELVRSFGTEDRAITLTEEAQAAAPLAPERANRWSVEAFELSQQLPKGGNRAPIQKNALRALAVNDPDRALALYRQQDLPAESAKPGQPMGEDPRSLGEGTVFQPVWRRWGYRYLQKLEDLANYLASTGQYPYAAMAEIAADTGAKHPSEARKIISDATSGFLRDPGFLSTNQQFVEFIARTHRLASTPQIRHEVHSAVQAIEKPENAFSQAKWLITVTTPAGTTTFNSEREVLLYRLLPLLRIYLPREAQKIATQYHSLRAAPVVDVDTPIESAGVISMQGTADTPRMRRVLDESRLFHAQELARSNPQQAQQMAEQITDPDLKAMVLVGLVPHSSSTDAPHAEAWMQSGKQALSKVVDEKLKLRLATALASAYLEEHDPGQAEGFIEQAFHLGIALFTASTKTNPQQFSYMATGYRSRRAQITCLIGSKAHKQGLIHLHICAHCVDLLFTITVVVPNLIPNLEQASRIFERIPTSGSDISRTVPRANCGEMCDAATMSFDVTAVEAKMPSTQGSGHPRPYLGSSVPQPASARVSAASSPGVGFSDTLPDVVHPCPVEWDNIKPDVQGCVEKTVAEALSMFWCPILETARASASGFEPAMRSFVLENIAKGLKKCDPPKVASALVESFNATLAMPETRRRA